MTIAVTTNYVNIIQAVRNWLITYAPLAQVIFLNQAELRPAPPYAAIMVTSDNLTFGLDYVDQQHDGINNVITRNYEGPRQMKVQVDVYTVPAKATTDLEAQDYLNRALLSLQTLQARALFRAAKMTVLNHTPLNRLDEQLGERWERRAQTDLTILYSGELFDDGRTGEDGNYIQTVQVPTQENGNATFNP